MTNSTSELEHEMAREAFTDLVKETGPDIMRKSLLLANRAIENGGDAQGIVVEDDRFSYAVRAEAVHFMLGDRFPHQLPLDEAVGIIAAAEPSDV